MRPNEATGHVEKKTYVKPQLLLHGSVQKLTEHHDKGPAGNNNGSNISFPTPIWGGPGKGW